MASAGGLVVQALLRPLQRALCSSSPFLEGSRSILPGQFWGPSTLFTSRPSNPHQPVLPVAPEVGAVALLCCFWQGGAAPRKCPAGPGGGLSGFTGTLGHRSLTLGFRLGCNLMGV